MDTTYTHITDLTSQAEPPEDGILSRTIYDDERIKAVIFGFGAGQELSQTSPIRFCLSAADNSCYVLLELRNVVM